MAIQNWGIYMNFGMEINGVPLEGLMFPVVRNEVILTLEPHESGVVAAWMGTVDLDSIIAIKLLNPHEIDLNQARWFLIRGEGGARICCTYIAKRAVVSVREYVFTQAVETNESFGLRIFNADGSLSLALPNRLGNLSSLVSTQYGKQYCPDALNRYISLEYTNCWAEQLSDDSIDDTGRGGAWWYWWEYWCQFLRFGYNEIEIGVTLFNNQSSSSIARKQINASKPKACSHIFVFN